MVKIHEPLKEHDVELVKVFNRKIGKKFSVSEFPTLTLFRAGKPLPIPENPLNADAVLAFLLGKDKSRQENKSSTIEDKDDEEEQDEGEDILSLPDQVKYFKKTGKFP